MMTKKENFYWQNEAENYFSSTPHPKRWFEFLGWITAFSTLSFLSEKTGSIYLKILYYVSYAVLYNYLQKLLFTTKFQNYIPLKLSNKAKNQLTYFITVVLVTAVYLFITKVVQDITATFP
jgi:hypothetical protein